MISAWYVSRMIESDRKYVIFHRNELIHVAREWCRVFWAHIHDVTGVNIVIFVWNTPHFHGLLFGSTGDRMYSSDFFLENPHGLSVNFSNFSDGYIDPPVETHWWMEKQNVFWVWTMTILSFGLNPGICAFFYGLHLESGI